MSLALTGTGVARGVVIGRVHHFHAGSTDVTERKLKANEVAAESERFRSARREATDELRTVRDNIPAGSPSDITAFIESHLLMMQDAALSDAVVKLIEQRHPQRLRQLTALQHRLLPDVDLSPPLLPVAQCFSGNRRGLVAISAKEIGVTTQGCAAGRKGRHR